LRRVAIVLVCLAVIIVIAACYFYLHRTGPVPPAALGNAPPLVSLLPPQAPLIIYADVASLRKSAFLERLVALIPAPAEDPEYSEFVRATGFDYSRDLNSVAVAIYSTSPHPTIWAIAEGHFDQQRITAYVLRTGKPTQRDGRTVYVIPNSQGGGNMVLSFLSPDRIELINNPNGGSQVSTLMPMSDMDGSAMKERVSNVAGSSVFAVARMDAVPKDMDLGSVNLEQVATFLQNVQWLSLSAVPAEQNLKVVLEGKCDSTIHAANLQLALQGFKFMGRAMLSQASVRKQFTPEGAAALTKVIGEIDISRGNQSVALTATFTPELLAGLAAPAPQQQQRPPVKTPTNPGKANH